MGRDLGDVLAGSRNGSRFTVRDIFGATTGVALFIVMIGYFDSLAAEGLRFLLGHPLHREMYRRCILGFFYVIPCIGMAISILGRLRFTWRLCSATVVAVMIWKTYVASPDDLPFFLVFVSAGITSALSSIAAVLGGYRIRRLTANP